MDEELKQYLDTKFAEVNGKLAEVNGKLAEVDGKFAEVNLQLAEIKGKVAKGEADMQGLRQCFEAGFAKPDVKAQGFGDRIAATIAAEFAGLRTHVQRRDERLCALMDNINARSVRSDRVLIRQWRTMDEMGEALEKRLEGK